MFLIYVIHKFNKFKTPKCMQDVKQMSQLIYPRADTGSNHEIIENIYDG